MTLSEFYPVIVTVGLIVGAIMLLRVFFTLWKPVERLVNGDKLALTQGIHLKELKGQLVSVRFKSGRVLSDITFTG